MSEAQNKEATRRFSAEVWGEGNASLADVSQYNERLNDGHRSVERTHITP